MNESLDRALREAFAPSEERSSAAIVSVFTMMMTATLNSSVTKINRALLMMSAMLPIGPEAAFQGTARTPSPATAALRSSTALSRPAPGCSSTKTVL